MHKLSVVGRDCHARRHLDVGSGIRQGKGREQTGTFWTGLWQELSGWAFFDIPGIGPVLIAGPMAEWVIASLDNAAIFSGLSPLGAALYSIGIAKDRVIDYENALRGSGFLVIAYGTSTEVTFAGETLGLREACCSTN